MSELTDKIKKIVSAIAPTLATAIGTTNPAAGVAMAAISHALLRKENATEEELYQGLQMLSPDKVLELQKAELDHIAKMRELDVDETGLYLDSRANAREREKELGKNPDTKDPTPARLAYIKYSLLGFISIAFVFEKALGIDGASPALMFIAGAIVNGTTNVDGYYYGDSNTNSKNKNEQTTIKK